MLNFFRKTGTSGTLAKDRLKMVLISDRINTNDQVIALLRRDVMAVLSKYLDIDENSFDLEITPSQTDDAGNVTSKPALTANIPINDVKNRL